MNCFRIAPLVALMLPLVAGCSNSNKSAEKPSSPAKTNGKLYAVAVENAAFFKRGPQAGRTPDQTLAKESIVRLIRPSFGYSKVEIVATHEQGYVATDDIRPANTALLAAVSAPKIDPLTPLRAPEPPSVEQFNLNSDDPRLVPPPEDLPPTELPAAAPGQ